MAMRSEYGDFPPLLAPGDFNGPLPVSDLGDLGDLGDLQPDLSVLARWCPGIGLAGVLGIPDLDSFQQYSKLLCPPRTYEEKRKIGH